MTAQVPCCVEPGWRRADLITNAAGPTYRLLWWSDTRVGFEHLCDRGDRGQIICAPLLAPEGHRITRIDGQARPTVTPSVLCPDCGTHGFITAGRWSCA